MSERDKFLTEAMGECWHEAIEEIESSDPKGYFTGVCKCGCYSDDSHGSRHPSLQEYTFNYPAARTNFSTADGFFKLWNWAKSQKWWYHLIYLLSYGSGDDTCVITFIHPDRFADAVYDFLTVKE